MSRPDRLFEAYAFDLDGTVYLGDDALPGAVEAINRLREWGKRIVFVTNKPLETAVEYAEKLNDFGIASCEADVVTAADSLVSYLHKLHPGAVLLAISEQSLQDVLTRHGFLVTTEPAQAQVVVVSFDRTFDYAKLNAAYRAVKLHGAVIVATNPDAYCPTPDGGLPDCAAMLAAIEACTGVRAEAVLGKPSHYMVDTLLERLGVPATETAMVGDRLNTDMAMAELTGMVGVLVLSGATTARDVQRSSVQPRYVIDDLSKLLPVSQQRKFKERGR